MRKETDKRFLRDESGAVAATYALALIPLIAMAGLAFDYTRVVGMDTELQNAADQAALAGATQLDRTDGSMERAINAIQGGLVSNSTLFSNDGSGRTVAISDANTQITFFANKADAEAGTNGFTDTTRFAEAGFVQVTVDTRAANYALTPIVGAISGSLTGSAVAGLGSALCRVPPLMICNPDERSGSTTMDVDGRAGFGLLAKPGGGGQWVPGNYGYLDVGLANGAVGVRQALGWGSAGNCIAQVGPSTVDTQTGNIANAPGSANTRFDVYENNACETGGDCPSAINVRKDMVRPAASTPGSGKTCEVDKTGWQLPYEGASPNFLGDAYLPVDATTTYTHTPKSMGHPRDICHAVYDGAPGDCWDVNGNFGDGVWDRDAYFRTNYIRGDNTRWGHSDWQTNLASALLDLDGDGSLDHTIDTISRFEVYKWEESKAGTIVDGVTVLGDQPYTSSESTPASMLGKGSSVCSQAHGYTPISSPDRRKLSVAVVNCEQENVSGSSTNVPVVQWVDVFLVQVAADRQYNGKHFTGKDELYVEIIAENTTRGTGSTDGITIRRDVPYLVK
ncbi:pilus assembly protein TadG-related protein [Altererythrobacter sp.]|uniref:pilus assembly protein TadG-related protein n=1 Tax=Altererythrobacter sp. TaxID=1872480 RepID=UPI003D07C597